jgi:hypothetical protein
MRPGLIAAAIVAWRPALAERMVFAVARAQPPELHPVAARACHSLMSGPPMADKSGEQAGLAR